MIGDAAMHQPARREEWEKGGGGGEGGGEGHEAWELGGPLPAGFACQHLGIWGLRSRLHGRPSMLFANKAQMRIHLFLQLTS